MPEISALLATSPTSLISMITGEITRINIDHVGLLASPTSIKARLFETPFQKAGIAVTVPDRSSQEQIELCIRNIIAGQSADSQMPQALAVIQELKARGAQRIVLGCTELSVIFETYADNLIIDPLDLVIHEILK